MGGYAKRRILDLSSATSLNDINSNFDMIFLKVFGNIDGNDIAVINTPNTVDGASIREATIDEAQIAHAAIKSAHIDEAQIQTAHIGDAQITNAKISNLVADRITGDKIAANTIEADSIVAHSITADQIATDAIVAGSTVIATGAIGSAQISDLNAGKIKSGTIDTSLVEVMGTAGRLKIKGNRLQVFDETASHVLFERVALGDVEGDGTVYGFRVRGADGTTLLIDEKGVKNEGITDGAITNPKINANANISATKIDMASVVTAINNGTTTITSSKIFMDDKTLDIAFDDLETQTGTNTDSINTHSSSIKALNDSIVLKATKTELQTVSNTLTDYKTQVTSLTTRADGIDIAVSDVKTRVKGTETSLSTVNSYFNFAANGLTIGSIGSPFNIKIDNQQINFNKEGTGTLAYINGTMMYIDKVQVVSSLVVGYHKIEKLNNSNLTLIRYIGSGV